MEASLKCTIQDIPPHYLIGSERTIDKFLHMKIKIISLKKVDLVLLYVNVELDHKKNYNSGMELNKC